MDKAGLTQYRSKGRGMLDKTKPWLAGAGQIRAGRSGSGDPVPEKAV